MELFPSNIKKLFIFQEAELSHILQETETLKTSYISGSNFSSSKNKKNPPEKISYTSENKNPKNISYISSKESFSYISQNGNSEKNYLYFRKQNLLIFQEVSF